MKEIVLHVEKRYGKKEIQEKWYFEVWNEPDLGCFWTGTREDYFKLYDYAAQGLQEADPKCRIGGPAVSGCNPAWVEAFLHHVRSGKNFATGRPGTKCDFVSYHVYSDDPSINGLRSTPGGMLKYQRMVEGYIGRFGFEGAVFCTEWAPCSGNLPLHSDLESAGSFVAKTIHLLADNAGILPMAYSFWCISDIFEEWDARPKTAFDGSFGLLLRGDPAVPDSFEVAKASFNAFKILHQLGDQRLEMTGGTMGNGVNGLATRSGRSLQILLYNHVDGGGADSALADTIKLAVNNLPVAAGKAVMERIILDRAHSNAYLAWKEMGSPSRPTAEQWAKLKKAAELHQEPAETLQITGGRLTGEFKLNVYGVTLLKIAY